jgi:hypothetical protein
MNAEKEDIVQLALMLGHNLADIDKRLKRLEARADRAAQEIQTLDRNLEKAAHRELREGGRV